MKIDFFCDTAAETAKHLLYECIVLNYKKLIVLEGITLATNYI